MASTDAAPGQASLQLVTETLGFSPQILLDGIVNTANHAVEDGVNGVEDYLQEIPSQADSLEQGLVSFQTLLEFHTDLAFDYFELWAKRNIFAIPSDLPVVLPHNENINLTHTMEEEQELFEELNRLRNELDGQRRLRRELMQAKRRKTNEVARLRKLYDELAPYEAMGGAASLPSALIEMHKSVSNLPELQPATISALSQFRSTDAGTRQWEMGKTGYLKWATTQLLAKAKEDAADELLPDVENVEILSLASAAMDAVTRDLSTVPMQEG